MSDRPNIPNYLVHSILVTLCCCIPLGIVGIVYAAQVNNKLAAGDFAGAEAASKNARLWCLIGLIGGVIGLFITVIAYVLFFAAILAQAKSGMP